MGFFFFLQYANKTLKSIAIAAWGVRAELSRVMRNDSALLKTNQSKEAASRQHTEASVARC